MANDPARSEGVIRGPRELRVYFPGEHSLGPGKVALLEAVREQGSISAAARTLGMAHRHASILLDDLNRCFKAPVVQTATGGAAGGGTTLTRPDAAEPSWGLRSARGAAARE